MTSMLTLEATHLALREIGPWLASIVHDDADLGGIELAVHELATNSVDHASSSDGHLTLTAELHDRELRVELTDAGAPFHQDQVVRPDADEPQVRGYGLMIIEQLADDLTYERVGESNVWTALFRLDAGSPNSSDAQKASKTAVEGNA